MSHTLKNRLADLAIDILSEADLIEEFDDSFGGSGVLWIKIDRDLWETFQEILRDKSNNIYTII